MANSKSVNILFSTVADGHILYKGFFQGIEIRIEGEVGTYETRFTRLVVRAYHNGHLVNYICRPFRTMATARKHAREFADDMAASAVTGREQGWPEKADHASHLTPYRNYHDRNGLPYYRKGALYQDGVRIREAA